VPGDFGWTDVGDFHTVGEMLEPDENGNVLVGEDKSDVLLCDVTNAVIVPLSGRLVAALGVSDIIVVDTPDAVLVCRRDRAQDVKALVDDLKLRGDSRV
jgi:mannose-1-phosphate guanylyltransferase